MIFLFICVTTWPHSTHVEVKGEPTGVNSLLVVEFWELNYGGQARRGTFLSTDPACQPHSTYSLFQVQWPFTQKTDLMRSEDEWSYRYFNALGSLLAIYYCGKMKKT